MKNVIVVGGNSMADLRNGIDAALAAMEKGGVMYCVGASSADELRAAKAAMETMGVGGITNPNYTALKGCGMGCPCTCGCGCDCEDEYEDECEPTIGYRWHIKMADGYYEPHEKTFVTYMAAITDAAANGYADAYVGVDKVEDDGGCISVIETIKEPSKVYYADKHEDAEPPKSAEDELTDKAKAYLEMLCGMLGVDPSKYGM